MKRNKNCFIIFYTVVNIAPVVLTILTDMMLRAYKRYAFPAMPFYYLYIFTPIVISILSFIKIKMQSRMPVKLSRLLNIIVIIFFVIAVKLFYHTLGCILSARTSSLNLSFIYSCVLWRMIFSFEKVRIINELIICIRRYEREQYLTCRNSSPGRRFPA